MPRKACRTIRPVPSRAATLRRDESARLRRAARSRANRRIFFFGHCLVFAMVVLLLAVVASPFVAVIVALSWGVLLASNGFFFVLAPALRKRWMEAELGPRVQRAVSEERRLSSGRHGRALEDATAQLAHEIRSPITAVKSLVQQIAEEPASSDNAEYARVAVGELDRVERSIAHLLRFSRQEPVELEATRLSSVVESALETLKDRLETSHAFVERDLDPDTTLLADADKLRRIVINLVGNASDAHRDAPRSNARIWISTGESVAENRVWLRIKDNGPGIEPARLEKIFTPFFTTKRDGTGLGLAITKKLVDAHGGNMEVHSAPGVGTEFLLSFPRLGAEPEVTP